MANRALFLNYSICVSLCLFIFQQLVVELFPIIYWRSLLNKATLLLPKCNSTDMQVIRDKLVLDLEPCFRYLDKDRKDGIRVVTPMVMLLEADGLDDAGIG